MHILIKSAVNVVPHFCLRHFSQQIVVLIAAIRWQLL